MKLEQLFGVYQAGGRARRQPPYFRTTKIALLGSTASLMFAPWADPSWTLVAHPCCRPRCKREPDWYFDLHRPACFQTERKIWNPRYYAWLKALQTPIFMQECWPEIPMAVRYPKERILAEYRAFFTNHTTWLIALAMTEGATHIGLFGCQYAAETEHGVQRESLIYWLGRFEQSGGTLVIPPMWNTLLCKPKGLYGYESHDEQGKLLPEYRAVPTVTVTKPDGTAERRQLAVVDPLTADGRVPLMKLPNGEAPAWERSGHVIHA